MILNNIIEKKSESFANILIFFWGHGYKSWHIEEKD